VGKLKLWHNLDVLVSDMVHLYRESNVIQNVPTNIPDGQPGGGKQSDHSVVFCQPRLESLSKPARVMVMKKTRRFNENRKRIFATWIQSELWEDIFNSKNKAEKMIEIVNGKLDQICPVDEVQISQLDGKINSLALQKLTRLKQREYTKHGWSAKYKDLKKKVKHRVKKEGEKAISNMLENAKGKG
jgi:hypothetical protein